MEDLLKEAQELQHKIVEWRRILHRYPETGLVLPKTADFVTKQLTAAGIAYKTYKNHSGITAVIGKGEGKTIAIRADMDGLPIKEETVLHMLLQMRICTPAAMTLIRRCSLRQQ